ncbi:MAG TPA: hemerythrin domain-containing protein [Caulobacteraceae bacterium]
MPDDNKATAAGGGKLPARSESSPSSAMASSQAGGQQQQPKTAAELLKADHRRVEGLFAEYETAEETQKPQLLEQICDELIVHTLIEERVFYPACRKAATDQSELDEAQVEHDATKLLILDLMRGGDDPYRDAKVKVLGEEVKHHIAEEERPASGILARAAANGADTPELARRLLEKKQALEARKDNLPDPRFVSLSNPTKESSMPRHYSERDERGRFTDDDGGRGYRSRDDEGRGYRSRDDEGRFTSRGSRDDDDRGRGHGGWFGDPEGHSRASERGWEERRDSSGRYSSRDDDDRRHSRGRDDDRGRGHGGWFGDPRGHSEASREGWDRRR